MRTGATVVLILSAVVAMMGCAKKVGQTSPKPPEVPVATVEPQQAKDRTATEAATEQTEPDRRGERPVVAIETTKGKIVAELYPEDAPKTVANFLKLAKEGYYDNMVWHRVEPGFVIQTGQGPERPTIPDEVNRHKHRPGALAMAKPGSMSDPSRLSEPDSASTQFYITLCDREAAEHLNSEFTVFGQVIEGMDLATRITQQDKVKTIRVVKSEQ